MPRAHKFMPLQSIVAACLTALGNPEQLHLSTNSYPTQQGVEQQVAGIRYFGFQPWSTITLPVHTNILPALGLHASDRAEPLPNALSCAFAVGHRHLAASTPLCVPVPHGGGMVAECVLCKSDMERLRGETHSAMGGAVRGLCACIRKEAPRWGLFSGKSVGDI